MVHLDLSDTISLNRISAWKWDQANYCWKEQLKKIDSVAAIAPSFCLHLSFLRPVFESQAPHLCFSNLHYWNCHEKGTKKQAGIGPFKKENSFTIRWHGMLQENIRCWGKYHCTTGLQVDKFGFNWFTTKRYKKQHSILFGGLQSC